ncbi:major facilitator superfamily transporter [Mycena olivaceomarginata]|nr:major facilitator superfamily transporter [Mycena olivaceomarginata]
MEFQKTVDSDPGMSQVPDGGYGSESWAAVFGCARFWFVGSTYSWGLMQPQLSFVGSSTAACISALGLINARVIRFLGARRTALLGISPIGLGQVLNVASVTLAQYFNKRRGLAMASCGTVTSFAIDALIKSVGPRVPAACLIKERTIIRTAGFIDWSLFRDPRFIILFFAGAIGTFPLFAAPFFLPPYSNSTVGLFESGVSVGLVAGSNFLPACAWPHAMLAIRPVSTSLALLVLFVVVNGGSFSTMPTVRAVSVSVAMRIIIGAPIAGYIYLLNAYGGAESMYAEYSAYRPAPCHVLR